MKEEEEKGSVVGLGRQCSLQDGSCPEKSWARALSSLEELTVM